MKLCKLSFTSKCRPSGLCQVVSSLNGEQRCAVQSIGFGGLLELKDLSYIPWNKIGALLKNFNFRSRILSFGDDRSLEVTEEGIHDVFMLPLGLGLDGGDIDEDGDEEEFNLFLRNLKDRHKRHGVDSVSALSKSLKDVVTAGVADGDFPILFALYASASFLAPMANQLTDFSLMRSLIDTPRIKEFKWCGYVLRKLCNALDKNLVEKKNVGGCLLLLPILYFHRFQRQGVNEPSNLPLIQHWTSKKFKSRLDKEIESGGFGKGDLVVVAYPITVRNVGEQPRMGVEGGEAEKATDESGAEKRRLICFNLLPTEKTDEEIHEIAKNPSEACFLLFQRDLNIVSQHYLEKVDRLEALDSLARERDFGSAAETLQASTSHDLRRTQLDNASANQKIQSLNDTYRRLQEFNMSLQSDLDMTDKTLRLIQEEKAAAVENQSTLRGQYTFVEKEALVNEVVNLRGDLQQVREDRSRQLSRVEDLLSEVAKYKECTGKYIADLESLMNKVVGLESICSSQSEQIRRLQELVASAENKLQLSNLSASETIFEIENKTLILELKSRVADADKKIVEGEKLRKKLHNTILELKGNIRVFCRVRPLLSDDGVGNDVNVFSFPTSMEMQGRGIDLSQHGQKHSFTFDKVFMPDNSQEDVFVEISQLVQSALDGYKVCIFAYGQTGSGKTYTMMGRPGPTDQKGLIPRSLEQVFQTRQMLEAQGWKYEMKVSMLEVYNETIRDLLATNKSTLDSTRVECAAGKQYAIKHDANGDTYVSDLTIVDVCSSKEVSYLLERAAHSRSVGKTQMNEQSSRSHFVFTLRIIGCDKSTDRQVKGVLNLIDLAGSERLSKSGATGDQLKETQAINKSLSSLSDVIFALANKEEHVPFRNSKLTYLLQPSLGGNSKTLMFVNVSPDPSSAGESLCSLRFAARVSACAIGIPRRQTN